ncbi:potassium transporter [Candidatus Methanoplasma termitum]|uniref:Potassium transporter n=1 Tax=Candidatus Methanoplasma termitum TaxID=1577791 RepID=A0A0A7LE57_9ARCH|nr:potassium transporter TrkG [Candidatus Methanoplasma termitum]AIZ56572.1 potassium transporter [Candidatus Methanoplasma termitum]MCL2333819.1 TrkH family potassium uptake protein [Candidatus Methanoplasma sp.]
MFHTLKLRIKNIAIWESSTVKVLGLVELMLGMALLMPAVIAFMYDEDPMVFIVPAPILLILGAFQYLFFKRGQTLRPASGLMMIFLVWWIAFFVSAVPLYLYGMSFVDSLFQGISGFTATGASIMNGISSHSLVFWVAFTQWAGGLAIIVLFLYLIPMMGLGGKAFLNNELAGSESYNFSMKISGAVSNFVAIYVLLSAVEAILLVISGVSVFESVTTMFSTISTGGFMANGSMADYSFVVQFIVLAFMFLGGTNFYLHYRAIYKRELSAYRTSQEFIWTVISVIASTVIIMAIIFAIGNGQISDIGGTFWDTLFTVVSFGTTTGYAVVDQPFWPIATYVVFWLVMLAGFMSGSTSGGIKIYRFLIIKSYITNGVYKMFHPLAVKDVKMDNQSVNNDAVVSAVLVISMFIGTVVVSLLITIILEPSLSISESTGLAVAAISNSGVNMGTATFMELKDATKIFMAFMMWVGRLEVIIALLLFTKTFWSDLAMDIKGNRAKRGKA